MVLRLSREREAWVFEAAQSVCGASTFSRATAVWVVSPNGGESDSEDREEIKRKGGEVDLGHVAI